MAGSAPLAARETASLLTRRVAFEKRYWPRGPREVYRGCPCHNHCYDNNFPCGSLYEGLHGSF